MAKGLRWYMAFSRLGFGFRVCGLRVYATGFVYMMDEFS